MPARSQKKKRKTASAVSKPKLRKRKVSRLIRVEADGKREMKNETITLSQLESHLWESANILRGPVDAADFKTYVFPLLFFKRISDVYDEEYAAAFAESG